MQVWKSAGFCQKCPQRFAADDADSRQVGQESSAWLSVRSAPKSGPGWHALKGAKNEADEPERNGRTLVRCGGHFGTLAFHRGRTTLLEAGVAGALTLV